MSQNLNVVNALAALRGVLIDQAHDNVAHTLQDLAAPEDKVRDFFGPIQENLMFQAGWMRQVLEKSDHKPGSAQEQQNGHSVNSEHARPDFVDPGQGQYQGGEQNGIKNALTNGDGGLNAGEFQDRVEETEPHVNQERNPQ